MTPMDPRELFANIVMFDTSVGQPTQPLADYLADYLHACGAGVMRLSRDDGQVTLIGYRGTLKPGDRRGLLLSGHLDVVPAAEPEWQSDPFELVERDGRFHARGAADMKGFVSLAVDRLARIPDSECAAPLMLVLTCEEETGSRGAQRLIAALPNEGVDLPRNTLVGEPTALRAIRMHKGHLRARFRVSGRAAHSGFPQHGVNAIEHAAALAGALANIGREWRAGRFAHAEHFSECPFPVLNIGRIAGGGALNVVPDSCEIGVGVRLLPGQSSDVLRAAVDAQLADLVLPPGAAVDWEIENESPPLLCPETAPLYRQLCEWLAQSETLGENFASDAGTLARAGCECVLFGPGCMTDAHRPNESLEISQWHAAGGWLDRLAQRFCRHAE